MRTPLLIAFTLASFAAAIAADKGVAPHSEQGQRAILIVEGSMLTSDGELLQAGEWLLAGTVATADEDTTLVTTRLQVIPLHAGLSIGVAQHLQPTYVLGCICICGFEGSTDAVSIVPPKGTSCDDLEGIKCFPPGEKHTGPIPSLHDCFAAYVPAPGQPSSVTEY